MMGEVILADLSDFVTRHTFLGNHLGQWLTLLGILLAGFIVGKALSFMVVRQANRLGKREGWVVLELLLRCVERPATMVVLAGGLYVAGRFLTMAPQHHVLWDNVAAAIAVLAGAWAIYRLVDVVEHFLLRWTSKTDTELDDQLVPMVRKTLRVFVVIVALLFVADNVLKWDVGALVAGLGIGGLAFALASKDMLANMFGSVTIFADRPFAMGDRVKIAGHDGIIEQVGFRSTRIRTLAGHLVTIPNGTVANAVIENVAARPNIRRDLDVTVTYDTSPDKLRRAVEIIREMLEARKEHLDGDNNPRVHFTEFNADSLSVAVTYWFAATDWSAYLNFNHEFNMELLARFNEEGIEFAFPTQTLYVKRDPPDAMGPAAGNAEKPKKRL